MADHTPNAMKFNKAKFKPHDRQKVRVAKGSWDAATDGTLDAGNGDTLDIVTVPARCFILGVSFQVETAENVCANLGYYFIPLSFDMDVSRRASCTYSHLRPPEDVHDSPHRRMPLPLIQIVYAVTAHEGYSPQFAGVFTPEHLQQAQHNPRNCHQLACYTP